VRDIKASIVMLIFVQLATPSETFVMLTNSRTKFSSESRLHPSWCLIVSLQFHRTG